MRLKADALTLLLSNPQDSTQLFKVFFHKAVAEEGAATPCKLALICN